MQVLILVVNCQALPASCRNFEQLFCCTTKIALQSWLQLRLESLNRHIDLRPTPLYDMEGKALYHMSSYSCMLPSLNLA